MIAKFPQHIRDRWNQQVLAIRKCWSRQPSLADLIAFVEEETLLVNDPLFSNNAFEQYLDWTDKSSKRGSTKYFVALTRVASRLKMVAFKHGYPRNIPKNEEEKNKIVVF